ncbi:MAG: hypothetical protein ACHQM6_01375 [Candidatus Kapaibacterium sp.]
MGTFHSIGVEDEIEKLLFPSFFDRSERKAAFEYIMLWGDAAERLAAEKARDQYPFDEPEETLFPWLYVNDFPIAGGAKHV